LHDPCTIIRTITLNIQTLAAVFCDDHIMLVLLESRSRRRLWSGCLR
jgi:hypothetical protein